MTLGLRTIIINIFKNLGNLDLFDSWFINNDYFLLKNIKYVFRTYLCFIKEN